MKARLSLRAQTGSAIAEELARVAPVRMDCIGIEDRFGESGDYLSLLDKHGLSATRIVERCRRFLSGPRSRHEASGRKSSDVSEPTAIADRSDSRHSQHKQEHHRPIYL